MIARSFRSVAWVAAIGAAALICYIFSLKVAEERAGLAQLDAQIRRAERSIQSLRTELGTRGRVHQLQHWASADFGYAAPTASQFVADEMTLASLDTPVDTPALEGPVRLAQAPAAAAALPRPVQAAAPARAPTVPAVRTASAPPAAAPPAGAPLLRRAGAAADRPAQTRADRPAAAPAVRTVAPLTRAAAPLTRAASLVNAQTLRDLDERARSERGGNRGAARPR